MPSEGEQETWEEGESVCVCVCVREIDRYISKLMKKVHNCRASSAYLG